MLLNDTCNQEIAAPPQHDCNKHARHTKPNLDPKLLVAELPKVAELLVAGRRITTQARPQQFGLVFFACKPALRPLVLPEVSGGDAVAGRNDPMC